MGSPYEDIDLDRVRDAVHESETLTDLQQYGSDVDHLRARQYHCL
jgi:hypothetical protein